MQYFIPLTFVKNSKNLSCVYLLKSVILNVPKKVSGVSLLNNLISMALSFSFLRFGLICFKKEKIFSTVATKSLFSNFVSLTSFKK